MYFLVLKIKKKCHNVFYMLLYCVDESRAGVDANLDRWRSTLKFKGFRPGRSKTEYIYGVISHFCNVKRIDAACDQE